MLWCNLIEVGYHRNTVWIPHVIDPLYRLISLDWLLLPWYNVTPLVSQKKKAITLIDKLSSFISQRKLDPEEGKAFIFIFHSVEITKRCALLQSHFLLRFLQNTMYTYTIQCSLEIPQDIVTMWTATKSMSSQSKTRMCELNWSKEIFFITWSVLNQKLTYSSRKKIFIAKTKLHKLFRKKLTFISGLVLYLNLLKNIQYELNFDFFLKCKTSNVEPRGKKFRLPN